VIEADDPSVVLTSLRLHWGHEKPKALDVTVMAPGNAPRSVVDRGLPEMQHQYRAQLLQQTMESCVLPAAPLLSKSTISSSSISSGGNRSTAQYPPMPPPKHQHPCRRRVHSRIRQP
jgi:hypothetical protein